MKDTNKECFVYKWTHKETGKMYIGSHYGNIDVSMREASDATGLSMYKLKKLGEWHD